MNGASIYAAENSLSTREIRRLHKAIVSALHSA
jgi:hypothetical protein